MISYMSDFLTQSVIGCPLRAADAVTLTITSIMLSKLESFSLVLYLSHSQIS